MPALVLARPYQREKLPDQIKFRQEAPAAVDAVHTAKSVGELQRGVVVPADADAITRVPRFNWFMPVAVPFRAAAQEEKFIE